MEPEPPERIAAADLFRCRICGTYKVVPSLARECEEHCLEEAS